MDVFLFEFIFYDFSDGFVRMEIKRRFGEDVLCVRECGLVIVENFVFCFSFFLGFYLVGSYGVDNKSVAVFFWGFCYFCVFVRVFRDF